MKDIGFFGWDRGSTGSEAIDEIFNRRRDIFGGSLAKTSILVRPPSAMLLPSSLLELEEAGNKKMRRPGMDDDVTLDTETYYVTVVGHLQLSNYPISVSRAFFFIAFHARLKLHFQVLSKILTCFLNK